MAYTKYSLTPANNTAAPPDGAPEGMLPSAVNDTMRDMMAQIRDVGDGVRDGTYTMTTPKITGGTITGAAITASSYNGTVGATTASTGAFTTLTSNGATTFTANTASTSTTTGTTVITGGLGVSGRINSTNFDGIVGANTAAAGSFTTINASTSITNAGLTSGRVTFAGASGLLSDSSTLTYDGTSLTTPRLVLGGTTLPSAGTATLFSRTSDNNTYLQTGSGNNFNLLDGSQNTMVSFAPTLLSFAISNSEKMRIDSSGNVGIGTSSPSSYASGARTLVLASSGDNGMTIRSGTASTGALYFANAENSTSNNGTIEVDHNFLAMKFNIYGTGRSFRFLSAGTEVVRIDSSGNLLVGTTTTRSNAGDVQVSKGISFPATQSAQSDANTLDDYEEGTFTVTMAPSTSGTITMDSAYQTMAYTKIGRLVMVTGEIVVASVSSPVGTTYSIQGLPFTCANLTQESGTSGCSLILGGSPFTVIPATIGEGETAITVRQAASTVAANWNPRINFSYFSAN